MYCDVLERLKRKVFDFPEFCAVLIQSTFRMHRIRKRVVKIKELPESEQKEAAAHILVRKKGRKRPGKGSIEEQIQRIQQAWRSYYVQLSPLFFH